MRKLSKITQKRSLHLLTNHLANDSSTSTDRCVLLFRHLKPVWNLPRQYVLKTCSHAPSLCRILFKVVNILHCLF